jgi:hypothetical protein
MAVKHTGRKDGKGNLKTLRLTPLRAIKEHCLECVGWQVKEVQQCTGSKCWLYPFRFGRDKSKKTIVGEHLKNFHFPRSNAA